jgi:hypothetical protein
MDAEKEAVKQQLLEVETAIGNITLSKAHIAGVRNDGRT